MDTKNEGRHLENRGCCVGGWGLGGGGGGGGGFFLVGFGVGGGQCFFRRTHHGFT